MIDDDSNELIPSDGGGDNDENAEDGNADDVQSVSIIQDEQGITFLGDAGVIDLWLKSEGFDSKAFKAKAVQTVSMASKGAQKASDAMVESGRWVSSPRNRPSWSPSTARTARKERSRPVLCGNRTDASSSI